MSTTYCTNCGAAIATGTFCTTCGTPVGEAPAQTSASPVSPAASSPAAADPSSAYQALNVVKQPPASINTLAIVALVTSLLGVHLAGIICGHIALNQIKTTGEGGRGLALAGLIIGYIFMAIVILIILALFSAFAASTGSYTSA